MKLPTKKTEETAEATTEALRQRRPAVLQAIEEAKSAIEEARAAHEAAFVEFSASESEATEKQLWLTEQRIKGRSRKLSEIQTELEALDGAIQTAERAELVQRLVGIDAQLTSNVAENERYAKAVQAAIALAESLLPVREIIEQRSDLRRERAGILNKLGRESPPVFGVQFHSDADWARVAVGIHELAEKQPTGPFRQYLAALANAQINL